jgi:hypothetical protein
LISPTEFNHHVCSEMGGIDKYNEAVGIAYINAFLRQYAEMTN